MNTNILDIEPKAIWKNFTALNAVPRPSKKEERVIAFMVAFGNKLGLDTQVDKIGNVIIKKRATKGMENRKTVVLQSHLDMVHQKNNDTVFDFDTQGIKMYIDGDWVRAKGTTLGADNGLGVAAIMSVLESDTIVHPNIEALFTIDEETGMTGAKNLQAGYLDGEILLNLDTEDDDEIDIGCAGGIDITATKTYTQVKPATNSSALKITLTGLNGGHSGMDIHKGLGNANKLMNRLLYNLQAFDFNISEINGGSLRNAIPREGTAIVVLPTTKLNEFTKEIAKQNTVFNEEFHKVDPNLTLKTELISLPDFMMDSAIQKSLLQSIYAAHNGVYKLSLDFDDLVETSNNLAKVVVKDGQIKINCLTRSSVESTKYDLAHKLKAAFELGDFNVEFSGAYPGWKPNPDSPILHVLSALYEKTFGKKPGIEACHAGLECGILGTNYPDMDMISFGPTIQGAHSPDERASISSTHKFWLFLQEVLKEIPVRES
ncbi:MAG: aminoacyl-histidine dipeptidase [Flavobacteriales bacterium]|nr:aminoacyl-histidine dipeptidase [Flavobacteriales bacterium]